MRLPAFIFFSYFLIFYVQIAQNILHVMFFNQSALYSLCKFCTIITLFYEFFYINFTTKCPNFINLISVLCFITIVNRILIIACQYLHRSVINTKNHIVIFNNFKASGKCVRHSFLKMCILRLFYNHIYMDIFTILGVRYYYISFHTHVLYFSETVIVSIYLCTSVFMYSFQIS